MRLQQSGSTWPKLFFNCTVLTPQARRFYDDTYVGAKCWNSFRGFPAVWSAWKPAPAHIFGRAS